MTFDTMGLRPSLLARLAALELTQPTPIQTKAIPLVMEGRDVMGLAQTGTGKTLAFGLPIADALLRGPHKCEPKSAMALILAPTRELAGQIHQNLTAILEGAHLRVGLVVGGLSANSQAHRMQRGVHILVATPGRLLDLIERGAISLSHTTYLVLDEADQMLDLGFIHALRKIAKLLPKDRQTLLFSATMPKLMDEIAQAYLTNPVRVEVNPPGKAADKIAQSVRFVEQGEKMPMLIDMLDTHRDELALVFTRTKHGADRLSKQLSHAGFAVSAIHGNKSQGQRDRALRDFRESKLRVLVATDVAARGIDIPQVRYVYNFDMPNVADNYIHRIGRTARAGRDGTAISLCAPAEHGEFKAIEKLTGETIEHVGERPAYLHDRPVQSSRQTRGGGGGGNSGSGRGKPQQGKPKQGGKPGGKPSYAAKPEGAKAPGTGKRRPQRRRNTQSRAA